MDEKTLLTSHKNFLKVKTTSFYICVTVHIGEKICEYISSTFCV